LVKVVGASIDSLRDDKGDEALKGVLLTNREAIIGYAAAWLMGSV